MVSTQQCYKRNEAKICGGTLNAVAEVRGKLEGGRGSLYIVGTFLAFSFSFLLTLLQI
jgi:hypothetical protein